MSFQKITLTGLALAALSACAGQQKLEVKEQPKAKLLFDVHGNPVIVKEGEATQYIKSADGQKVSVPQTKPADSTNPYDVIAGRVEPKLQPKEVPNAVKQATQVDNSNPYDIISGTAKPKEQPKEQPTPLEQLKEPKYLPVALKAAYSFEKDGFGAGTFYGIIKKNNIDMAGEKGKVLDIVLNADQQKDKVLSDKEMADYVAKNKLTVSWVRDAPVYFEIEGSYEVEEGSATMFRALSQNSPARVLYILGDTKRVDKKAIENLADRLK